MKKTFKLDNSKIKYERAIEGVKHEVRKYIKRERRRELPESVDFLDFDCKFGLTEADATPLHLTEITKAIDDAAAKNLESFYIEIIGKERRRQNNTTDTPADPA
jgi:hypothetical protein